VLIKIAIKTVILGIYQAFLRGTNQKFLAKIANKNWSFFVIMALALDTVL
jgi:hypothetical protein